MVFGGREKEKGGLVRTNVYFFSVKCIITVFVLVGLIACPILCHCVYGFYKGGTKKKKRKRKRVAWWRLQNLVKSRPKIPKNDRAMSKKRNRKDRGRHAQFRNLKPRIQWLIRT